MSCLSLRRWGWLAIPSLLVLSPPALATQYLNDAQYQHIFLFTRLFSLTNYKARWGTLTKSGHIPPPTTFCQFTGEMYSRTNWETFNPGCLSKSGHKWSSSKAITNGKTAWSHFQAGIFAGLDHTGPVVKYNGHPEYTTFPHIRTKEAFSHWIIPPGKYVLPKTVRLGNCSVAGHAGIEYETISGSFSYYCIDRAHGYLLSYKQIPNLQNAGVKGMLAMMPGSIRDLPHQFYLVTQVGGVPPIPIPPK